MMDLCETFGIAYAKRKKFWLAPILFAMVGFGMLLLLTEGLAGAPFIYTLF